MGRGSVPPCCSPLQHRQLCLGHDSCPPSSGNYISWPFCASNQSLVFSCLGERVSKKAASSAPLPAPGLGSVGHHIPDVTPGISGGSLGKQPRVTALEQPLPPGVLCRARLQSPGDGASTKSRWEMRGGVWSSPINAAKAGGNLCLPVHQTTLLPGSVPGVALAPGEGRTVTFQTRSRGKGSRFPSSRSQGVLSCELQGMPVLSSPGDGDGADGSVPRDGLGMGSSPCKNHQRPEEGAKTTPSQGQGSGKLSPKVVFLFLKN